MPRESYSTTNKSIAMDSVAQGRATSLVSAVQTSYNAYELATYGSNLPPDVDAAYVRTHAIRVGLNRFPTTVASGPFAPTADTFAVQTGSGVSNVSVDVVNEDLDRAQDWADLVGVSVDLVLSAALCTGLGALSTDRQSAVPPPAVALGPFTP